MARRRDRPLWAGQEGSRPRTSQKTGCLRARRKEQDAMAEKTDRDTSRSVTPVTVAGTAAAALSPYVLDENIKIFFAGKPAKTERDMSRSIFLVGTPYQY